MKRTHPALLCAVAILGWLAARFAYAQFVTGVKPVYLLSGYRGAGIVGAFALACIAFPRVGRWMAASALLFLGIMLLPIALSETDAKWKATRLTTEAIYLGVGVWLVTAKSKPSPHRDR